MALTEWLRWPRPRADSASDSLSDLPLDGELFTLEQLEAYARELASSHRLVSDEGFRRPLLPQLDRARTDLENAYRVIAELVPGQAELVPTEAWLQDNFHVIQDQIREIRQDLPRRYYAQLPKLSQGPWKGLPRVYVLGMEFIAHTEGRFEAEPLARFVERYQEVTPLQIGEIWAIPIMLRLALVEKLRRLAVEVVAARVSRQRARAWASLLIKAVGKDPRVVERALARRKREREPLESPYVVELTQCLRDQSPALRPVWQWLQERVGSANIETVIWRQQQKEATNQLSIANAIGSMRLLSASDWRVFFERVSLVERTLRQDPAGAYGQMDFATRDRYRHSVEQLARRSPTDEIQIAEKAIACAASAQPREAGDDRQRHVGYYLISRGRFELERLVGYRMTTQQRLSRFIFRHPALGYLGSVGFVLALALTSVLLYASRHGATRVGLAVAFVLTLVPLSDLVIALVNGIITSQIRPRRLSKLALKDGVPRQYRTMVVVPTLLTEEHQVRQLVEDLHVRFLANRDPHVHFALLSDLPDTREPSAEDDRLVEEARRLLEFLNTRYEADCFFLFHRARRWNQAEGVSMGWERKRGKLEEFNRLLRGATDTSFDVQVGELSILQEIRFVITLDSDTQLPIDVVRQLVGAIAHPLNRPCFDPVQRSVVEGYGVLQPRIDVNVVSGARTPFARIFSGYTGVDPYTTAVSDIYQDLFHEGNYVGKGIYDVDTFRAALAGRVPENALLSHDLFEGLYARAALVSDIHFVDDYPTNYLAFAARQHRWVRGDWQLIRWLGRRVPDATSRLTRNVLPLLARWKIFDNLRRSLLPITLVLVLGAAWLGVLGRPGIWTILATLVLTFPAYMQIGRTLSTRARGVSLLAHLRAERGDLVTSISQACLWTAFLAHQAILMVDAIVRTLVRVLVTHRHLLEWETAAATASRVTADFPTTLRLMWPAPVLAVTLAILVLSIAPASIGWALPFLGLWGLSPFIAYRSALPETRRETELAEDERIFLRRLARKTWRYYEELVGAEDHWLVPDNYQEDRKEPIAHRTSPTNIGLQLLSGLSAGDFGYLTLSGMVSWLDAVCSSLAQLQRYRGHFYNWYDTKKLVPLPPPYISTVDSGNLAGYLLTLREGLLALRDQPILGAQLLDGLGDTFGAIEADLDRLLAIRHGVTGARPLRRELAALRLELAKGPSTLSAWDFTLTELSARVSTVGGLVGELSDAVQESTHDPHPALEVTADLVYWSERAADLLNAARGELTRFAPWLAMVRQHKRLQEPDGVPSLNQLIVWLDSAISTARFVGNKDLHSSFIECQWAAEQTVADIERLAQLCEQLVQEMDFSFLFDPQRQMFAIGFRVSESRLDSSYYDTLASEARLASFAAIATRKIAHEHWFKLGRAIILTSSGAALVSWSASMFEYLMPLLIMRSYPYTLLDATYYTVVRRQIEYAVERGVPWGISESAYNLRDAEGNYQYKAFGVPGLGLKPGLADDLVIAPYASILALPIDAHATVENLRSLADMGVIGRFGFYESIDYTSERLPEGKRYVVLPTFMAHHVGMSLIAIDNAIRMHAMQDRFHADLRVQSVELLLHERIPQLTPFQEPPVEHVEHSRVVSELAIDGRRYTTPHTLSPRAHLLSNGSYTVMLTNAGGGYSSRQGIELTRWHQDVTRDNWGSFCYIRDRSNDRLWSTAYQPTCADPDEYEVTMAPDRVVYRRRDGEIQTQLEVAVSPEDDAEVRRVSLTNVSDEDRELELTTYAEIVLATPEADATHPAFGNLFVETRYIPERQAIVCRRRPRGTESEKFAIHLLSRTGRLGVDLEFETDRRRFIGRGRTPALPLALQTKKRLSQSTGPVLDPIASLRQRVRIPAGATNRFFFVTAYAENEETVRSLTDKYFDRRAAARVLALASAHRQVELRHLNLNIDDVNRFQRLAGRLIYGDFRLRVPDAIWRNRLNQEHLWRHGISGDFPIVLANVSKPRHLPLVRELVQAQEYCRLKGFQFDLVVLNEDPTGYRQDLHEQLQGIVSSASGGLLDTPGGVFLRRGDTLTLEDEILLSAVARAVFFGSGGSLSEQLNVPTFPSERPPALPVFDAVSKDDVQLEDERADVSLTQKIFEVGRRGLSALSPRGPADIIHLSRSPMTPPTAAPDLQFFNGFGGFSEDGREYVIRLEDGVWTPSPWCNVIANPRFGFLTTESGAACTWSENSRLNRITPWSNDPVSDPPSEALYLRDELSGAHWSATPLPNRSRGRYVVRHGLGYTVYQHAVDAIESELLLFVPPDEPVKIWRLRLTNQGSSKRVLSATIFVDLIMGDSAAKHRPHVVTWIDEATGALFIRNAFRENFGDRTAFLHVNRPERTVTADRTGFLGRNGSSSSPAALREAFLDGRHGAALDPCGALQVRLELEPREATEMIFQLGEATAESTARQLIERYRHTAELSHTFEQIRQRWEQLTGAVQVHTPDAAMNLLLNQWLLYQNVSCRLWGRTGFYQSSGAYGFRDQLQDVLALLVASPSLARDHLVRAAARQFVEGDVQHWWHEPDGRGVRTRIADDRLWLPFAVLNYVSATGDRSVLDEQIPFLEAAPLTPEQVEIYGRPTPTSATASLYEHCVRAIRRSLDTGAHGLPLMGAGDWNDGMNLVGHGGKGESVWLGWFLYRVLKGFAEVARTRHDEGSARLWRTRAERLLKALDQAWDGEWYRRAYFDDGTPLGSSQNVECRIDAIAQSWALLSGAADDGRARTAMQSVLKHLVKEEHRLILLLTPPFDRMESNPGYIKGYVPGVRENGGQYTHAAVWNVVALAMLGEGDRAVELFSMINPVNRCASTTDAQRYRLEPYVVAGDVYSVEPHTGLGGWSWYTGSAGWLYRAGIESILGVTIEGERLRVDPCIPRSWPGYSLMIRRGRATYTIEVVNPDQVNRGIARIELDGVVVDDDRLPFLDDGREHHARIVMGEASARTGSVRL